MERQRRRNLAKTNVEKLSKSLTFSRFTLRINDQELDLQHHRFLQKEIRGRSKYLLMILAVVILTTISARLFMPSDTEDWGFDSLISLQLALLCGSTIALFLTRADKNKFTSIIGPLVYGSYVVCTFFVVIRVT